MRGLKAIRRPRFSVGQLLVAIAVLAALLAALRLGWDFWTLETARRRNIRDLQYSVAQGHDPNYVLEGWSKSLEILERSGARELRTPQVTSVGVAERHDGSLTLTVFWVQWSSQVTGFIFSPPNSKQEFELQIDSPALLAELAEWSRWTPAITHVEQLSPTGGLGQLLLDSARSGRPVRVTPVCKGKRVDTSQRELTVVLWDKRRPGER